MTTLFHAWPYGRFIEIQTVPHPGFFGHTVFLKLRIGYFSDTQKLPMVVTEAPNIFNVQCIWGKIFVSLKKILVFNFS